MSTVFWTVIFLILFFLSVLLLIFGIELEKDFNNDEEDNG